MTRPTSTAGSRGHPRALCPGCPGGRIARCRRSPSSRARHAAGRLAFLGELGPQYAGMLPSDSVLAPYFAVAEELDIPVLLHMTAVGGTAKGYTAASPEGERLAGCR